MAKTRILDTSLTSLIFLSLFFISGVGFGLIARGSFWQQKNSAAESAQSAPEEVVLNSDLIYQNDEYGFSLQYPEGSIIDTAPNRDRILKIEPPAEYTLAETQLTIRTLAEPFGESINRLIKQDKQEASNNLYTGVLVAEIDGLPAKRFYTIVCPERGSCEKTNKYYVNAQGITYIITTTTFVDGGNTSINEDATERIVNSLDL